MFKRFSIHTALACTLLFTSLLMADQNIFIVLGPPGAGKGTISEKLSEHSKLPNISTRDLLRVASREESPFSEEINTYKAQGESIPDELVIKILLTRFQQEDCQEGLILNGFPKTLTQAKKFEEAFPQKDHMVVVNISLGIDNILKRLQGRRFCKACRKSYHVTFHPPQTKNRCDHCNGKLISKARDSIENVEKRLEIYKTQYTPIKQFYKENYQWIEIKNESVDQCFENLLTKVELIDPKFIQATSASELP